MILANLWLCGKLCKSLKTFNCNDNIRQRRRAHFLQFISILGGYILVMDIGAFMAWPSPSLPYLTSNKSDIPVTTSEGPWLAGIVNLSGIIGQFFCLLIMNQIGRKYTLLIFALTQIIAWIFINLAQNFTLLCIGRTFSGIGYGGTISILPIYIGEISEKTTRGILLNLVKVNSNVGSFIMVAAGAFLPYHSMNLVMMSLPIIGTIMLVFATETPYFYLMKGCDDAAIKTLMKLRAVENSEMVKEDIERMKKAIDENQKMKRNGVKEIFTDRGSQRAFIIYAIVLITYCFSGYFSIRAYTQELLSYSNSTLAPEYATMIVVGLQIFAGLPSSHLIDSWGRRPVFLLSGISAAIMLGFIGLFFFLKFFLEMDVSSFTWVPLVCLIFYTIMSNLGIGVLPYVYAGELFSVNVKGVALMGGGIFVALGAFATKILMPFLNNATGVYTSFWLFSFFCIIGPIIVWFVAPETKGKNLEEILVLMRTKNNIESRNNVA